MTARRIGGSIRPGLSPVEGESISTRFLAEAITLTGTRRRLVEIDALVALGRLADRAAVLIRPGDGKLYPSVASQTQAVAVPPMPSPIGSARRPPWALFVDADSDVAVAFSPHRVDEDGLELPGVYDSNRAYR